MYIANIYLLVILCFLVILFMLTFEEQKFLIII